MNVNALKELYKAFGGKLTDTYQNIADGATVGDYSLISDCILAIAKLASSAGIELPAVTAADNGKVLKVIDGKWAVGEDAITA